MGLIAGFFHAYACSVMIGVAEMDDHTVVHTMQSINATVRNAGFAPSFFASLLVIAVTSRCRALRTVECGMLRLKLGVSNRREAVTRAGELGL